MRATTVGAGVGVAVVVGLTVLLGFGGEARAARFALLAGNNQGQGADVQLRFAETDTVQLSGVLGRFGGFAPAATTVMLGRSAAELRAALADIGQRLRTTPGEHLVLVYYSGHADAQALHLGSTSFSLVELKEAVAALPAATRILILDACQAGVLTRAKGGAPGQGFEVAVGGATQAEGMAILASSTGSEMAQESDQLAGSVFTHYLRIGLSGLADHDWDGTVSLVEAFDYVSNRTVAATLGTTTGPQHPTFRLDIAGREDLPLTRPGLTGAGYGHLRLDVPGWYFVRRSDGTIAAETVSKGVATMALEAGPYEITRREPSHLEVAAVNVPDGGSIAVSGSPRRQIAFGRMVRKGGGRGAAYTLGATTGIRTGVQDLGPSLAAGITGRVDLAPASLELRLVLGRANKTTEHQDSTTWDASASVALLRFLDPAWARGRFDVTWAVGAELGVSYLRQVLDNGELGGSLSPMAGPVALMEWALSRRLALRADVGVPIYFVRVQPPGAASEVAVSAAFRFGIGAGVSF